ncbi:MmcQ/YjbR family DNA-binding protein [Oceanobacter kriegii]|uniref:MmcQ/YjbR family DNA-binding protein n=1 Tax=Oceanobacter kriegii TaxID=64972 RepID=UPI000429DC4C|nr:MmcQ/YjbR family DNA-binding protein [Oceanobacter kriegii]
MSQGYETSKTYLLNKPEAQLDYPFGPEAEVYKIFGKMFALLYHRNGQDCVNLKCDPQEAIELRDVFDAVQPGYHMNKKHWNTVVLNGSLPQGEIERMIDNSYALVVKSLRKGERLGLEARHGTQAIYGSAN